MKEKELADKNAMAEKTKESDFAISYDRICIEQDKEDKINKEKYLQQFRNENKRVLIFLIFVCSIFLKNSSTSSCISESYLQDYFGVENATTIVYKSQW